MKPLDNPLFWTEKILSSKSDKFITENEIDVWNSISKQDKKKFINELLTKPIVFENPEIVYDWYFRNKWGEALKKAHGHNEISVLEVGAGGCDIVPKAMSKVFENSNTKYVTANLNKELTGIFKWKTRDLSIDIKIIEDDANKISDYYVANTFDAVVFEHSVNDVLESILAEKNSIDTISSNWMDILPDITEIVNKEYTTGTLENNVKTEFINLLLTCLNVLKPDGYLIFAHYQFQYNLDIGLNAELNENLMPIVRKWVNNSNIGTEIFFDSFDPQYWMFLRKNS